MKTIATLRDAFSQHLQRLYDAEKKVHLMFQSYTHTGIPKDLKDKVHDCADNANSKLLKLDRIFSYLMHDPSKGKNEVVEKILEEMHEVLTHTAGASLKNALLVGYIQSIHAYLRAGYKMAHLYAMELELDTAADLLQQILAWEENMGNSLCTLSVDTFTHIHND